MLKISAFFIAIIAIYFGQSEIRLILPKKCKLEKKYPRYGGYFKVLVCKGFRSFDEIKINSSFLNDTLDQLILIPQYKIIFDQSLDLSNLEIQKSDYWCFNMYLSDFRVFDLESSPFLKLWWQNKTNQFGSMNLIFLYIYNSDFEFYLKGKTIEKCDPNYFSNIKTSPFSGVSILELQESTKYPEYICPLVMQNLNLLRISFYLKNSFIYRNIIKFQESNATNFRTNINRVVSFLYKITIDSSFLNTFVYGESIERIIITGIINEIQIDLFRSFSKLSYVWIEIENLKEILHQGLKFINFLGSGLKINKLLYLILGNCIRISCSAVTNWNYDFKHPYLFPDEDFCLFEKVPDKKQLIVLLLSIEKKVCRLFYYFYYSLDSFYKAVNVI